jgi:hypothetical protein
MPEIHLYGKRKPSPIMCTLLLCLFYFGLVLLLAQYPLKEIPRLFCQTILIVTDKLFSWVKYIETTSLMIPKKRGLLLMGFYILAKLPKS